jgi:endonuclease YncB( thermonuclease family)
MPDVMEFRARLPRLEDFTDPVHDGDTVALESDRGDWIHHPQSIRLRDVHAPEVSPLQLGGRETRQFVVNWLIAHSEGTWPYWLDSYRTSTYRDVKTLDRFVGVIFNRDRSSCLNLAVQTFVDDHGYPGGVGS